MPATEICGLAPGEIFVHRNVANVVVHSDLNCLSVLQYAVQVLKVEQVVVCGHLGCGGVRAALRGDRLGLIDNWLQHVRDVALAHEERLAAVPDETARWDLLCKLNVAEQVRNVSRTTVVQHAWRSGQALSVHGVVYGLEDGLLHDLGFEVRGPADADAVGQLVDGRIGRWPGRSAPVGWRSATFSGGARGGRHVSLYRRLRSRNACKTCARHGRADRRLVNDRTPEVLRSPCRPRPAT